MKEGGLTFKDISEKTGVAAKHTHLAFELVYDSNDKTIQVNRTTDFGIGESDSNPLANDKAIAWKAGIQDSINDGEAVWGVNKNNGVCVQWKYNQYLSILGTAKQSAVQYSYLIPQVKFSDYNTRQQSYTATPYITGYFNNQSQTINFNSETLYATDAYNDGYDNGYVEGWKAARDSMTAKIQPPSANNSSGTVYAYAEIDSYAYHKLSGGTYYLSSRSTSDTASFSFNRGSVSVDCFYKNEDTDGALAKTYKSDGHTSGDGYNYVCAWGSLGTLTW